MDNNSSSFRAPPILNPPTQFFGGSSNDGSPLLPDLSFLDEFNDEGDFDGLHADKNDTKRRRIAKACDSCRKKKIKCDGIQPCKHCMSYKIECVFTQVEKKRSPPKGAKYIEGLENRLRRMEAVLRLSGLLDKEAGVEIDLATLEKRLQDEGRGSAIGTPEQSEKSDKESDVLSPPLLTAGVTKSSSQGSDTVAPKETKKEADVEELSDLMCSLVTNNCGETRYIGSSSGFSIFSPKGIQWVNEKTGDGSFQEMVTTAAAHEIKWNFWKPDVFGDLFARRTYQPLPPKDEALSLMRDFFENFNCMFPLFHEPTFMHLVDRNYSRDPYEGSGWWASFNVALAIAHRLRVMSNLVPQEEDKKGWAYLKNAMGVLTELTMRNTDLLSVQALLGMSLFLMGTPNPQPSFFLVAAAIRLANSIGLHKRGSAFGLNAVEIEQRKRVFWIAYLLDKDICLRSGRPPAQDDDDMNVELPTEDPADNIGNIPLIDGKGKANIFRFMVNFAIIESKVYRQLYSTKASKQSDGELLNTIGDLDKELEEWKDAIPLEIRPEYEIKTSHTPLMLHVVVMHFAYYNCLTTIHRMAVHHGYWTSRLSNYALQGLNARPLNPRVYSSATLCVQAARSSINLIRYIPQGDCSCVWLIIYFPVSALVTLFANILQNPQDPNARSDVKLMNQVVNFLSLLAVTEEQGGVKRMLGVCAEFERLARVVLDKTEKSSRHKRKSSKNIQQDSPVLPTQLYSSPIQGPTTVSPEASNLNLTPSRPTYPTKSSSVPRTPFDPTLNSFSPVAYPAPLPSSSNMKAFSMPVPSDMATSQTSPSHTTNSAYNPDSRLTSPSMPQFPPQAPPPTIPRQSSFSPNLNGADPSSPLNLSMFQEPFVQQNLWNMPMTLEWDWADMNVDPSMSALAMDGNANACNGAANYQNGLGVNMGMLQNVDGARQANGTEPDFMGKQ